MTSSQATTNLGWTTDSRPALCAREWRARETLVRNREASLPDLHPRIPSSHRDLIDGPYWAALATVMPDGQPQTTPIWCNRDGERIIINTMRGFRKERNMRANPRVTLLVSHPQNPLHCIEIRGLVVDMTEIGAEGHLDALTVLYLQRPGATFFGDCVPVELRNTQHPVKVTIEPVHVRVEG